MAHKNTLSVSTEVAKRLDVTCRKGDTFALTINAKDSTGTPIDFNVFNDMKWEVRPTDEDTGVPVLKFLFPSDFDTTVVGSLTITKEAIDMAAVESGVYVYDFELTDQNNKTTTWFYGIFKINDDVSIG